MLGLQVSRRGYMKGSGRLLAGGLLAAWRARRAFAQEAEELPPEGEMPAPEVPVLEGPTPVPPLQRTLLLDADWIGNNPRGRHAQYWVESWLARNPTYKIDYQSKGDGIVRLASDTYDSVPTYYLRCLQGQAGPVRGDQP